jgi:hypothetical protein
MTNPVKYIFYRLLGLILIVIIGSVIYQFTIYPEIIKSEGWLQELAEKKLDKHARIYYFSSSTNKSSAPIDSDKRSIVEIVQSTVVQNIVSIDTGAIHCGIFYEILKKIPESQSIDKIIVDLNVRSFGNQWIHSGLENSLQRNLVYWNNYPGVYNHLRASLKMYNYHSPAVHIRAIEYGEKFTKLPFRKPHNTIKNWCDSLFKIQDHDGAGLVLMKHFGHFIEENNPMLLNADLIVEWCKKRNIPLVFIILPEDISKMRRLVGEDLASLVEKNADFLEKRYSSKSVEVINLVQDLDENVFYETFPTEHYNSFGRRYIAQKLIEIINVKRYNGNQGSSKNSR